MKLLRHLLLLCFLWPALALAGSLSFDVSFVGDTTITAVNRGNESAYAARAWQLDAQGQWQPLRNEAAGHFEWKPGETLTFLRPSPHAAAPGTPAGFDPILFRVLDQAGSPVPQLAWRTPPPGLAALFSASNSGNMLRITVPPGGSRGVAATHVIYYPYRGVGGLALPLSMAALDKEQPPPVVRYAWGSERSGIEIPVGAGQPGAWLLHEIPTAAGPAFSLQVVPDGIQRGTEQRSPWLLMAQQHFRLLAALVGALGALLLLAALLRRLLKRGQAGAAAPVSEPPKVAPTPAARLRLTLLDTVVVVGFALAIATLLGLQFLLSDNLPTGGDTASHLLYAWLYAHELLPSGQITAWMPEVFAGFPFLSYYFPLPFIVIAALSAVIDFAPAMKLGMFAGAMFLPGAAWLATSRLLGLSRHVAAWVALAMCGFVLHEQNSIWGGNLLSTLAGEFAYGYGILFALLTLLAWQRTMTTGRHWWLPALLEAATGFSHGFALLVTGFATAAYLFDQRYVLRNLRLLVLGHGLAFLLLAGWLWPMLEMHALTIPNDALFESHQWTEFLPVSLQPVLAAGLVAGVMLALGRALTRWVPRLREWQRPNEKGTVALRAAAFMAGAALLAGVAFLAAGKMGLADIRFFPFVWLLGGLACALVWGAWLDGITARLNGLARWGWMLLQWAAALVFVAWLAINVRAAPDWGLWNHSGLESKPQFNQLSTLFPALSGRLDSPRLLFEHDPANNDIGSTRVLEALPMFLNHRPVLEGLYMESALISPAVYQAQSEVSERPSSPLARFPSGRIDPAGAAAHMRFLYSNEVLLRSAGARQKLSAMPDFVQVASAEPFAVFRLRDFTSRLVDFPDRPLRWMREQGWMEESFRWFRSRERFASELPVFHDGPPPALSATAAASAISDIRYERNRIAWKTAAPGAPHLLRVAWHPRWRLVTKGEIYLAAPGFMLVVPRENQVVLEYGHTPVGWLGMAATLAAFLLLGWLVYRDIFPGARRLAPTGAAASTVGAGETAAKAAPLAPWPRDVLWLLWPALLLAAGGWAFLTNAERLYTGAWEYQRAGRYAQAAAEFDRAYAARRSEAKREEALFWSAKAYELAGQREAARQRYRELCQRFEGYWLPESLYTLARLAREAGDTTEAAEAGARLEHEFPVDKWTLRHLAEKGRL